MGACSARRRRRPETDARQAGVCRLRWPAASLRSPPARVRSLRGKLPYPMPELPDLTVYLEALQQRIVGARLERVQIVSPFLLRTAVPPIQTAEQRRVTEVRRLGKRLAIGLEGELWLVFHLMIAGRLHWYDRGTAPPKRAVLARLQFGSGSLTLTEAGTKRRASLHLVQGEEQLRRHDPGGLDVLA